MAFRSVVCIVALLSTTACGGGSEPDPAPPPTISNVAPSFTSATTSVIDEGTSGSAYTATANDADGDAISFSIDGGADASAFSISGSNLSFTTTPNFERPLDSDRNNVYEVVLAASDGAASSTLSLSLSVSDAPEPYRLARVASGINAPIFLAPIPGSNNVFVIERAGIIRILNPDTGVINGAPFLNITTEIGTFGEGGMLAVATAPDFLSSGAFYVHITNTSGDTEIRRYFRSTVNPNIADASTGDVIFTASQPASNHNGGWMGFGADDMLYLALGDGGGGGDPFNNGQNANSTLSALLRIDPTSDDFPADSNRDYAIPADNPFSNGGGAPEIWAYGLRNPFAGSVDRQTGDIYLGDVGQEEIEEVDLIPASVGGLNFGWSEREGTQSFAGPNSPAFTAPVAEYPHGSGPREGNSIAGGVVYRGPIAAINGFYFFADFVSNNVWSIPTNELVNGATVSAEDFAIETDVLTPDAGSLSSIASFGEDTAGNLYIVSLGGDIFRIEPNG